MTWDEPLAALRWHWGSAYFIYFVAPGKWIARRQDTGDTLRADGPEQLRKAITSDYLARPVPR